MIKRLTSVGLVGIILLLALAKPLFAGGWVVVTLDVLPRAVVASEALTVGFTVRQHGQTLINLSPGPILEAHNPTTGEQIEVVAQQEGFTGHYRATITFPSAGAWNWQISPQPFTTVATLPPLKVHKGNGPAVTTDPSLTNPLLVIVQMVQTWWRQTVVAAQPIEQSATLDNLAQYGRDLFLAKGCTACHRHNGAPTAWSTQEGPDLSHYDKRAAFLQLWLADPAAVKPTTVMPNLGLNPTEIAALAAFLAQESRPENN